MELKKKILKTIKEHGLLKSGDKVVLGFSGGPDSLALFYALHSLNREHIETNGKKGISLELCPVHINHKLRRGAAEEDQKFSEEFSEKLGLECRTFVMDCGKLAAELGLSSEEAGRKARYDSFREVASEISGRLPEEERLSRVKIAVAQNADDRAETVLFRILRGTGIDGLSGIPYIRKDEAGFDIIRPLMDVTREEIEAYCEKEGLEPRRDHTNYEPLYTRNKIRLDLIPYLRENFNPSVVGALNRLADSAANDREYLFRQAKRAYEESRCDGKPDRGEFDRERSVGESAPASERKAENGNIKSIEYHNKEICLKTEKLAKLDKSVRYRVYNIALYDIGMKENVTTKFLDAIDGIRLSLNHHRAYTELTGGYRVARDKKKLIFYKNGEDDEF